MKFTGRFSRFFLTAAAVLCFGMAISGQVIYDNGPLATGATSRSGVAAPAGTQWSEVQSNAGETASSNTSAGVGCQVIGAATNNRCADDFIIPVGETWTINSVAIFVYQTGFAGGTSPVVGANLRIWSGVPEAPGSTILFGDTTTNRLASSVNANLFRVFNTAVPAPGTAPGTTRIIWQNNLTVAPALVLTAGQYWVDFQSDTGATTGNFTPSNTVVNNRGGMHYNALQKVTGGSFIPALDAGNPAASADYGVDFPFKLSGSIAGSIGPRRSRVIDFDGDNKSDLSIARSANSTSQTTWIHNLSGSGIAGASFGLGTGLAGGDKATPEDFDGDGKTDIAVWRPGAANVAAFYILQSQTNTVRVDTFGQTGDDPSIVDDYDGDGKSDVAVYRSGAQSIFFYKTSAGGPTIYNPWGIAGDVAAPGDYDGDRKADLAVIRNEGGLARHYHLRSTQGFVTVQFGLFTDKFVGGDFDGDNKTDISMVRANGSKYDWYVFRSSNGALLTAQPLNGYGDPTTDLIVPGDYDGDNRTDLAVWRSSGGNAGVYFMSPSNSAVSGTKWGIDGTTDYPVANYNVR